MSYIHKYVDKSWYLLPAYYIIMYTVTMTHTQSSLICTDAADAVTQSSFHCCVSVVAPAVNIIHEDDELNTSLVSSSTRHVSSNEDHHVHTCSNPTSTDASLNSNSTGNCFKCKCVHMIIWFIFT